MKTAIAVLSILLLFLILLDGFETTVLPRQVTRRFRFTRFFYRMTWIPWSFLMRRVRSSRRRESYLGYFGPLSLIFLLCVWAVGLILGFAMLQWALGSPLSPQGQSATFGMYAYLSGTTFFTLGFGDVTPLDFPGRALAVAEAGIGFAFLALIIGYVPVIYQAFSRREANISLLDARAGSPPNAAELLRRHSQNIEALDQLLRDWERWSADLMESHLSYPVLCYYRSQHSNQSWLAALTAILDTSALVITGVDGVSQQQAQLTFAIARHAVVDLAQTFKTAPRAPDPDRLPPDRLLLLRSALAQEGVRLSHGTAADEKLGELRRMYEPYVNALGSFLLMPLPGWSVSTDAFDNWQTSSWGRTSAGIMTPVSFRSQDEDHF